MNIAISLSRLHRFSTRLNGGLFKVAYTLFILLVSFLAAFPQIRRPAPTALEKIAAALLASAFPAKGPGAAALIVKDGVVLYRGASGLAEIPNNVPMTADHIFRIGSITKQFTAAAILKLQKEGKLSMEDDIKMYFPSFPNHGHTITIRHLLNHTSGIKSYTEMGSFDEMFLRKKLKPEELVDEFKYEDMDFAPGDRFLYNNSGYILLGLILEQASGMAYGDYLKQNFFLPLKMNATEIEDQNKIYKFRAYGYSRKDTVTREAVFMDMSLPYSAGALVSTVEDLYKWYSALISGTVLDSGSFSSAISPTRLNSGKEVDYGFGLQLGGLQGSRTIGHGGAINGFLSASLWLPDEKVFVAVFSNCDCNPVEETAAKLAALAMGKPLQWTPRILAADSLKEYMGVFKAKDSEVSDRVIGFENDSLFTERTDGPRSVMIPFAKDRFYLRGKPFTLSYARDTAGKILSVTLSGMTKNLTWTKTENPVPVQKEFRIADSLMTDYAGKYEYDPQFSIVITLEGGNFMAQATGQEKFPVYVETPEKFFYKVVNAQLHFSFDENRKVTGMVLRQGGAELIMKKLE